MAAAIAGKASVGPDEADTIGVCWPGTPSSARGSVVMSFVDFRSSHTGVKTCRLLCSMVKENTETEVGAMEKEIVLASWGQSCTLSASRYYTGRGFVKRQVKRVLTNLFELGLLSSQTIVWPYNYSTVSGKHEAVLGSDYTFDEFLFGLMSKAGIK